MTCLPDVAEPLLGSFSIAFTRPTVQRILVLPVGAIVTKGARTITNLLEGVREFETLKSVIFGRARLQSSRALVPRTWLSRSFALPIPGHLHLFWSVGDLAEEDRPVTTESSLVIPGACGSSAKFS